jgi:hypothetical protein
MNAFVIPASIGVFQQAFVDDTLYTVATGSSQDWTVSVLQTKAIWFLVSFSWSGGNSPTYTFRLNGTEVAAALTMNNSSTGSGLIAGFIGGHDTTDVARPGFLIAMDFNATGTLRAAAVNADLPDADTTSVGFAVGGSGNTSKFKYVRVWSEGSGA